MALGFPPGVPWVKNIGDLTTMELAAFITTYADMDQLEPIHPEPARGPAGTTTADGQEQPPRGDAPGNCSGDVGIFSLLFQCKLRTSKEQARQTAVYKSGGMKLLSSF